MARTGCTSLPEAVCADAVHAVVQNETMKAAGAAAARILTSTPVQT
jgi:hypothetical protein